MRVQVGCEFTHRAEVATHAVIQVEPRLDGGIRAIEERWANLPQIGMSRYVDGFGNMCRRATISPRVDNAVAFVLEVEAGTDGSARPYDTVIDRGYLRHTRLTAPDGAITELVSGSGDPDAGSLCARVHRSLEYVWGFTGVHTTASEALAGGRGVCQDYAHVMLAACRTAGVLARYVSGHLAGEGGSHAWVEVLHPSTHRRDAWIAEGWDPTHNRRTNDDYLVVAVGRDYEDAAPLVGTYDGEGATNTLSVDKRLHVM
jgi:transglutaminase-like putative cysteine protease